MHWPSFGGERPRRSGGAPGAAPAAAPASKDKKDKEDVLENFDPEKLERGAVALKELDADRDLALKAFELTTMQENTRQLEIMVETEKLFTARTEAEMSSSGLTNEEARKTISHSADEERQTAMTKAQLEAEGNKKDLEQQQKTSDMQMQKEDDLFMKQEQIRMQNDLVIEEARRETIRQRASFEKEVAVKAAQAEAEGRAKQERENVDIRLREMRAAEGESRRTRLESIDYFLNGLSGGFNALVDDKAKATTLVGGVTALALGVYGARAGTQLTANLLERTLGKPSLVRETFRWTVRPKAWTTWFTKKEKPQILDKIVLEQDLNERLQWSTNSLLRAKENGTPYRNLMLYGPPGTGKTLFARTLARESGLDYAVMSGGDLGPLGRDAVQQLHKMFKWANSSNKGLILFIDEADAFLRRGRQSAAGMSEDMRNALSAFLHHTGTESEKFMVVLATNVPSIMDRAVLDRMDEAFEFALPGQAQRLQILKMLFDRHINSPTKQGMHIEVDPALDDKWLEEVARRTDGFSGRQLSKLVLAYQAAVFGGGIHKLTPGLAETVLNYKLSNIDEDPDVRRNREVTQLKETATVAPAAA